jgi:hypothetical protein
MFAKIGHSPTKYSVGPTPRKSQMNTPTTARRPLRNRSPSPTPRGNRHGVVREDGNTTNLILDFTDQISGFSGRLNQSPAKLARQSPYKSFSTLPDVVGHLQSFKFLYLMQHLLNPNLHSVGDLLQLRRRIECPISLTLTFHRLQRHEVCLLSPLGSWRA